MDQPLRVSKKISNAPATEDHKVVRQGDQLKSFWNLWNQEDDYVLSLSVFQGGLL